MASSEGIKWLRPSQARAFRPTRRIHSSHCLMADTADSALDVNSSEPLIRRSDASRNVVANSRVLRLGGCHARDGTKSATSVPQGRSLRGAMTLSKG
jgi:hypothetical protein